MKEESVARIALRIQPGARKNSVLGKRKEAWKIAVQAPPVEGRANRACVEYLAELLGVRRSAISILKGEKSRDKVIEVKGIGDEAADAALQSAFGQ